MSTTTRISDAEWDVMEIVWKLGTATAAEVIDRLVHREWNHRTVRTMLSRLVAKGVLRREGRGQTSVYRAAITRERCVRQASRSFLQKIFGGDASSLLVHFVRDARIGADEIEQLKRLLDEKTPEAEP